MVDLLEWDHENDTCDLTQVEHYKSYADVVFPEGFYIHPERENNDFQAINPGDPLYINFEGETITHDEDFIAYPMFINEAAYQNSRLAMTMSKKIKFT